MSGLPDKGREEEGLEGLGEESGETSKGTIGHSSSATGVEDSTYLLLAGFS